MENPLALHRRSRHVSRASPNLPSTSSSTARTSPILEFLFFHKAIRAELEWLRRDALAVEKGDEKEFHVLSERYQFLRLVYFQHSNAEDEVIFPALDSRVKNVAQTYSLEHQEESGLFDQMLELLNSALKDKENVSMKVRRELICCTEAIQTTLCQHMSKEEEQVFPLLMQHFSFEEQSALVWQFICSIPVNLMEGFLPWLASSLSQDERQEMIGCIYKVVPKEELLHQVIFAWLNGGDISSLQKSSRTDAKEIFQCTSDTNHCTEVDNSGFSENLAASKVDGALIKGAEGDTGSALCKGTSKRSYDIHELNQSENENVETCSKFPINELLYWHNAIRRELKEFSEEARKLQWRTPSKLSSFCDRLQFLAEVCIFYSAAESKVIYPAVYLKANRRLSYESQLAKEEHQFDNIRHLLEGAHNVEDRDLPAAEIYGKLCAQADLVVETVQQHLLEEEIKVLPLAREFCSVEEQRSILYQSLRVMPLKLLERVLPWLVTLLNEEEAKVMLQNMRLAAPVSDTALVTLFSGWACKGHTQNIANPGKFRCISSNALDDCPIKKINSMSSSCYCEAVPPDLPSEQNMDCLARPKEWPSKRPRHEIAEHEEEQFHSGANQCESSALNQTCCVPRLGVSCSSLGFGAGSGRRNLKSLSINALSSVSLTGISGISKPIDAIFQFHKAIRKDLDYLDIESAKLVDCDGEFLRQFTGRFRLLWSLYRAHSNAEDEIVFPALEAKEALHNVSHSYMIDHMQEEQFFSDIDNVLCKLSQLHRRMQNMDPTGICELHGTEGSVVGGNEHHDDISCKQELAAKMQGMCKSVRISLDQHVSREELELWPLFDMHFTLEEQDKIIGRIIGTTGAEVLQAMLPWVTTALSLEEQTAMMDTWRQATRNTMFDEWLRAWWKGSPTGSPHSTTSETEAVPQSGTPESLQMVADYFSRGVTDNNSEKEITNGSSETDLSDGKEISCGIPATNISDFEKMKKGIHDSETCDQVQTSSDKRSFSAIEENGYRDKVEDGVGKFKPGWQDIFRMNQKELEAAIRKVSSDTSLDPRRKAYLMQNLMTSRWIASQQQHSQAHALLRQAGDGPEDIPGHCPSYNSFEKGVFGCEHYKRNCKVRAACCGLLFTCRFCHDKVSDHTMDRQATKEMMCMKCLEIQPVAQHCATPSCDGFHMARYFCSICKFFDDDNRDIYHCPSCNLCRVGKGLGVDYFHCMTCNACMSMTLTTHKCREKGLESNCPICHDFLFTSNTPVKALSCGHFMHSACFQAYTCSNYTCPICSKSLGDMAVYFGMLDALLATEQLPDEYRDRQQDILCNDCEQKGSAPFHWLYHKCNKCGSYNTRAI